MINRILLIIPVVLLFSVSHLFADFQKGLDAYNTENYGTARDAFKPLAEQGDAEAQFYLGEMYSNGRGVPRDDEEAVNWYMLAAEQGNARAQNSLGWMYSSGDGVPEDDEEAVKWFTLAAEQGYARAQFRLGDIYASFATFSVWEGVIEGGPEDDEEAVKWFTLAAEQGYVWAQFYLGWMYDKGHGVPEDDVYAYMWWNIASSLGNENATDHKETVAENMTRSQIAEAQFNLGLMYDNGDGVPEDNREAVKWWTLAAEQGYVNAQNALGWMYRMGAGVPNDDV